MKRHGSCDTDYAPMESAAEVAAIRESTELTL